MTEALYDPRVPDMTYKDKVDIRLLFFRQTERCLQAAGTQFFGEAVESLARLLPAASYLSVTGQEDRYIDKSPRWIFKTYQGYDVGTKENPHLIDEKTPVRRFEDGGIDWDDPNIFSPRLNPEPPEPDYLMLFRMIIDEAENVKIIWDEAGGGVVNLLKSVAEIQRTSKKAPRTPTYKRRRA